MSGKFQRVNANNERIETLKIVEFPKFSTKIESFKTFYESHLTSKLPEKKLFILPPHKSFLRLWNKNFLTEIYGNILTFTSVVLQECSSWASENGTVQMLFVGLCFL